MYYDIRTQIKVYIPKNKFASENQYLATILCQAEWQLTTLFVIVNQIYFLFLSPAFQENVSVSLSRQNLDLEIIIQIRLHIDLDREARKEIESTRSSRSYTGTPLKICGQTFHTAMPLPIIVIGLGLKVHFTRILLQGG